MLKLSKNGEKEKADIINQMLMPLHERYVNHLLFSFHKLNIDIVDFILPRFNYSQREIRQNSESDHITVMTKLHCVTSPLNYGLFYFILL